MIKLSNVTLIAVTGKNLEAHQKALDYSCKGIEFGAVKLIFDHKIKNIVDWSHKIIYELGDYIETDYALLIHADGFVVNPESWRDEFLQYDYIGAPFPLPSPTDKVSYRDIFGRIRRVGNSVSLRSKRLINLARDLNLEWRTFHGYFNEDGFICVNNVHVYESHGMKFAPIEVAKYFSREHDMLENKDVDKPFCFHASDKTGLRNDIYKNLCQ